MKDVAWDLGYSLCRPETAHHPLSAACVHATFQPVTHQRGIKPFGRHALLIDGALFSPLLAEELRELPVPPRRSNLDEKLEYAPMPQNSARASRPRPSPTGTLWARKV